MLRRVQLGLETLYRLDSTPKVGDFVIDSDTRERLGVERAPREQLLLTEDEGELSVGLFIDEQALTNLASNDPTERLHDGNVEDFLLVVEGVSHFVYLTSRAQRLRSVSGLELELQAEIDKYVTCLLGCDSVDFTVGLRRRIFDGFELVSDLSPGERERYRIANSNAYRYSESLEERFVRHGRHLDMLVELRRFYRLSLGDKLSFIKAA
jgi:hypothetical protein